MKYNDFLHFLFAALVALVLLVIPLAISGKTKKTNCRKCIYRTSTGCSIITWEERRITDENCGFYREEGGKK
jgi:hypothetical protein